MNVRRSTNQSHPKILETEYLKAVCNNTKTKSRIQRNYL